jgi:carboxymethylenebutenolidase
MERKKASDFPRKLLNLFEGYVHEGISRWEFLDGAQKYASGGVTAAALWGHTLDWSDKYPRA